MYENFTTSLLKHVQSRIEQDMLTHRQAMSEVVTNELFNLPGPRTVERKLSPDDLIIADGERPIALAGVMGGFDTMITERTRNVLIE